MEASAFFQVCTYLNINGLAVIKGVTDMGDEYKGVGHDRHYLPALKKAARATRRFVEYVLGETDVGLESASMCHIATRSSRADTSQENSRAPCLPRVTSRILSRRRWTESSTLVV